MDNYAVLKRYIDTRLESNSILLKERGAPDWLYHKGWCDALSLIREYAAILDGQADEKS